MQLFKAFCSLVYSGMYVLTINLPVVRIHTYVCAGTLPPQPPSARGSHLVCPSLPDKRAATGRWVWVRECTHPTRLLTIGALILYSI